MAEDESSAESQRSLKRREFLRIAGLGAVVLGAAGLGLSRLGLVEGTEEEEGGGGRERRRENKEIEIKTAFIQFSKNGEPVGKAISEKQANDLHVVFSGRGTIQFLRVPPLRSPLINSPEGKGPRDRGRANGFRVNWSLNEFGTTGFTGVGGSSWFNHRFLPPRKLKDLPVGESHVFKFKARRIKRVWWTKDTKRLKRIRVPRGANDLEFSFK